MNLGGDEPAAYRTNRAVLVSYALLSLLGYIVIRGIH